MNYKQRTILFFLVLCLLPIAATGISDAANLLENSSFTETDEEGLPVGWYTDAYIQESGYTLFRTETGDKTYPAAVLIQNIGENDARFAQRVIVEPDSLYCLSGYICADEVSGGHGANLSVEGVYAFSEPYFDTNGEWQYVEYYGVTGPEQNDVVVFARLGGYSGTCTGKAMFADLSLTRVESIPGDTVADLWYTESDDDGGYNDGEDNYRETASSRLWLILIIVLYTLFSILAAKRLRNRQPELNEGKDLFWQRMSLLTILLSMALRILISSLTEGYMVDVNCFQSWGRTFASVGPAGFYQATSFCDYPPLYTYILGLNSFVSGLLGGGEEINRIVFRFLPSLCDLIACWILYRILLRQKYMHPSGCFLFLLFTAFHPASILNSAAWGQMDSVLCLMLFAVALTALESRWIITLPLYVVSVLIKPQALMLGPLGLVYIILSFIRKPEQRRQILTGTGISIIVYLAGMIPFTGGQEWDWLIRLYSRTLSSYPYATVNTANLYYLLGGNWSAVDESAHFLAPVLIGLMTLGSGIWWWIRAREVKARSVETCLSFIFAAAFLILALTQASWAWVGGLAMAYAFVMVLSPAVRSGDLRMLPWLGGLLFILLYVFGVKMHERYLFPAFLLLTYAWVLLKDRRILYVLILFGGTVFLNEGIVLDNSIRLGSQLGHLNSDTVWLADLISLINIFGSCYAVRLSTELLLRKTAQPSEAPEYTAPAKWKGDNTLHWNRRDTIIVSAVTAVFAAVSLMTLGSTRAPQTTWSSSSAEERIVFDLGEHRNKFEILYFAQVSRSDFSISVSEDGNTWEEETWAQMDQGQCWKWKYVTESYETIDGDRSFYNSDINHIVRFSGRYVRLTARQISLKLNEILFRTEEGQIIPAVIIKQEAAEEDSALCSDPAALLDEQNTLEALPSLFTGETEQNPAQPSWWNSTYFDEIYHARTAYEFLQGSVPYETSHPPFGKVLMSAFVAIFGMTPFGWRFAGALAGILMLPGMYLIAKQLTKKTWPAFVAISVMSLDCMHLTQTQIATIDSFPVLFILFAYFFMLRFIQTDFMKEKLSSSLVPLAFSGLFMGFSIASKWIGIYAGAGLAVLFFWHCARVIRLERSSKDQARIFDIHSDVIRRTMIICLWCVLFFVLVPLAIYLLSYIPYMAYNAKRIHSLTDYIREVWNAQVGMFNYHSTPNLGMDHPFYSPWWEWPVIGKPMYYAANQYLPENTSVHHSIFCFGNPVIWFGGLAALAVCAIRFIMDKRYRIAGSNRVWHTGSISCDPCYVFLFIGILAQYLPWVLVPRGTYIYHYFASLPFLMLSVAQSFNGYKTEKEKYFKIFAGIYIAVAAVFFILLFPYASGLNVSDTWLDIGRRFLRIWY